MPRRRGIRARRSWLDPSGQGAEELGALLAPLSGALMDGDPVGPLVNSPSNDDPRCIAPAG